MFRLNQTNPELAQQRTQPLEIWGGLECTLNRVRDTYFDQLIFSGHDQRITDLDLFAQLGISAIRYPVLWERFVSESSQEIQWDWADQRLERLRQLGIRPIVGLVHHGSGPRFTNLMASNYAVELARFARDFAEHFPWVDAYIPINEPLTTARFSGLYGHWYPHGHDGQHFARALINQARAIQLVMKEIHRVNPKAQLIVNEDLGKVFSTPKLRYQADFENERRWLSFDLLSRRVDKHHPMFAYLASLEISEAELEDILAEDVMPDLLGIDYYITSERFLDEKVERYPDWTIGGNGRDRYADVEAVRVCPDAPEGIEAMIRNAWDRYHIPMAATEIHMGGPRESQLRWLMEAWQAVQGLQKAGVNLRAITVWALLGLFNWDRLVTEDRQSYECGVFDLRAPEPRPTLIARAVQSLVRQGSFAHPLLNTPGWWHQPERLLYPPQLARPEVKQKTVRKQHYTSVQPVLITGATGTLGMAFQRVCEMRGIAFWALSHQELDISEPAQLEAALDAFHPWAVINAAGYAHVKRAEMEPISCWQVNTMGAAYLAAACEQRGLPLLSFSSDMVFDGGLDRPYLESDLPHPLNAYGSSKAAAEQKILRLSPEALVVRTSAFFSPWDESDFLARLFSSLAQGKEFPALEDSLFSPTYVPDLVQSSLDLLIDGEHGIWHLSNLGGVTWGGLARQAAQIAGLNPELVVEQPAVGLENAAQKPRNSALASERSNMMPGLEQALEKFLGEWTPGKR